ncbi:MAG: CsbD family protein [Erysipelothrix sp.]|nr:CsbD family protein [Erysipelothrix sp.]
MSDNKFKEIKDKVVGKVKEETGKLTDNEELELKGKIQQGIGKAREVAEDVKDDVLDKVNDVVDDITGKKDKA